MASTQPSPPQSTTGNAALDQLTVPMAAAMAPMPMAIAIFSLTLLRQTPNAAKTYTDELFAFFSAVCLLGSATSADAALDNYRATWQQSLVFLRFGYPLFCLAIGFLTTAVAVLYAETAGKSVVRWEHILFAVTGFASAVKPMILDARGRSRETNEM
jgi:hypothetical protein